MNLRTTTHFDRAYAKAPKKIQDAFQKQVLLLMENLRHPSLHAKKYHEGEDLWQARVTRDWRVYFRIEEDTYILQDIMRHPKK
jgi:mRNA-degrading endonuclease RelE of RelBE toxin-antitoxin system